MKNLTTCKYDGKEYSNGSEVCQSGRVKECINGEWKDTGRDCGEKTGLEISLKQAVGDDFEKIAPLEVKTAGVYTHYTLEKNVSEDRDKIYGYWNNSIAAVCTGAGYSAYIFKIQVKEKSFLPGTCAGNRVLKVVIET